MPPPRHGLTRHSAGGLRGIFSERRVRPTNPPQICGHVSNHGHGRSDTRNSTRSPPLRSARKIECLTGLKLKAVLRSRHAAAARHWSPPEQPLARASDRFRQPQKAGSALRSCQPLILTNQPFIAASFTPLWRAADGAVSERDSRSTRPTRTCITPAACAAFSIRCAFTRSVQPASPCPPHLVRPEYPCSSRDRAVRAEEFGFKTVVPSHLRARNTNLKPLSQQRYCQPDIAQRGPSGPVGAGRDGATTSRITAMAGASVRP